MEERDSGERMKAGGMLGSDSAEALRCHSREFKMYSLCKGDNPKIRLRGKCPWSHVC